MPTGTGKMQLVDYDLALVVRGFDAFQPSERSQLINFGYRAVARKFPFTWQQTTAQYTVNPGEAFVAVQGGLPLSIDSIRAVFNLTDPLRKKMEPEKYDTFLEKWLYLDLTSAQNCGEPNRYFLFEGNLYLLPPPVQTRVFEVHFYQWLPDMVNPTDVGAMPQAFDEVILDAALARCHRRAHEMELAQDAQDRVNEAIDDMLRDDVWQMEELQERTLPDDQWL